MLCPIAQWESAMAAMKTALDRFHDIELKRPLIQTEPEEHGEADAKLASNPS
jgi:hypothetical protein